MGRCNDANLLVGREMSMTSAVTVKKTVHSGRQKRTMAATALLMQLFREMCKCVELHVLAEQFGR